MLKRIYIVGYKGNMARRYRACLDYLGVEHCGHDVGYTMDNKEVARCDGIIIATPTETHLNELYKTGVFALPTLCEKPITLTDIERLPFNTNIQMVNQYKYCISSIDKGPTYYDCWNTGKDGLAWDCINVIGLSDEMPSLMNTSPIWKCILNGKTLTLNDIENGYIKMLDAWCRKPEPNIDYIYEAHQKVRDYIEKTSHDSNSGKID